MKHLLWVLCLPLLLISGCATTTPEEDEQTQLQQRRIQTRVFDTADKQMTMRNVASTLQDLNYVIYKTDYDLGSIVAQRNIDYHFFITTVTVTPKGEDQMSVRNVGKYRSHTIDDAEQYQQFFNALQKRMFLTANGID